MTAVIDTARVVSEVVDGVLANGGATVDPFTNRPVHAWGFYVGGAQDGGEGTSYTHAPALARMTREFLNLPDVRRALHSPGASRFVGAWVEGDAVVLDVSDWITDRDAALALARRRGERAVWDAANGREVWV